MITKISNLVVGKKNPKHEISKNTERKNIHMKDTICNQKIVPVWNMFRWNVEFAQIWE